MMRILLDLYLEKNLGDDLFLISILKRYPNHQFFIFTQLDYHQFEQDYPNLKLVRLNKYFNYLVHKTNKKIALMKRFVRKQQIDALVSIGGSIFIEFPNWEKLYQERINLWRYFDEQNKPIYVIGSNFGPYHSQGYLDAYQESFGLLTDICFRDQYSYDLFKQLPNVRLEADAVFDLEVEVGKVTNKTIGISVIDLSTRDSLRHLNDDYIQQLTGWIEGLTQSGYTITLMSFCKNEGDEVQIQRILDRLDNTDNIKTLLYDGDVTAFLNGFQQLEKVIATRFHSIVLSILYGKEIFAVNYSKKSDRLIEDNQLSIPKISIETIKELSFEDILNEVDQVQSITLLKQSGSLQFEALDKWLKVSE